MRKNVCLYFVMQIDSDKFRPVVVRALRYYQKMLNDIASNEGGGGAETVLHESDLFGYYLLNTAREAGTAAKELNENPNHVTSLIKEDRYRSIVQQAVVFYIAELRRRQNMILDEQVMEHIKRISSPYGSELSIAESMKQHLAKN